MACFFLRTIFGKVEFLYYCTISIGCHENFKMSQLCEAKKTSRGITVKLGPYIIGSTVCDHDTGLR